MLESRGTKPVLAFLIVLSITVGTLLATAADEGPRPSRDYLIVTVDDLEDEFQRLADHRQSQGYSTMVVTMDWVEANTLPGEDRAATLRNFLEIAHDSWNTEMVLLGGDRPLVPARVCWHYFGPSYGWRDYLSDLYFACFEDDWNADGDTLYGEYGEDDPDIEPQIALGRAPVETVQEAAAFVDKVLAHEATRADYHGRALMIGTVIDPYPWNPGDPVVRDGAEYCEDAIAYLEAAVPPLTATRLYQNYTAWEGAFPLTGQAVVDSLATGHFGLIDCFAHANGTVIDVGDAQLGAAHLVGLSSHYPVMIAISGFLASHDVLTPSLMRALLRVGNSGIVAGIGSSSPSYLLPSIAYHDSLFAVAADPGDRRLGTIWRGTLQATLEMAQQNVGSQLEHKCLTLLGDPALSLGPPLLTSVPEPPVAARGLRISSCSPNPCNPVTTVAFEITGETGSTRQVHLAVHDLAGRLVRSLYSGSLAVGSHRMVWDGDDNRGRPVGSGVYLVRASTSGHAATTRVALVR